MTTPAPALRSISAALVALLLAGGVVALTAAPASADADPPTLSISGNPGKEDYAGLTFAGECATGSDNAVVSWLVGGTPQSIAPQTLDGNGEFSGAGPYFPLFPFVAGTTMQFTLTCRSGTTDLASSTIDFTFPDLGATVTLPATATVSAPIAIPYDCGAATGGSTLSSADVTLYNAADDAIGVISGLALPGGTATGGTPASYGLAVGETFRAYLNCYATNGGSPFLAGYRGGAVTTVIAALVIDPPAGPQDVLAATGPEQALRTGLLALALLVAGGVLLARRDTASR